MSKHAILSPSSAHRWAACPGSVVLSRDVPNESSEFADEGTAAHQVAAWCLGEPGGAVAAAGFVGRIVKVGEREIEVTQDMADHVQAYVGRILEYAHENELFVEQALTIEHITGEPEAAGTSDAVILTADEIQVHDLKYGRGVKVDAEENPQLILYALGALEEFAAFGDFQRVRCVIHQPRLDHLSEWSCTIDELLIYAERLRAAARQVEAAHECSADELAEIHLKPGDKQCRFCPVKATCPALARHVQDTIGAEFEDISNGAAKPTVPVAPDELSYAMRAVDLIEGWCKAVRAEVERVLFAGGKVDGFKLVEGRKGARAWSDEAKVEEMLRKQFRLSIEQAYSLKLITPPAAEKLLAKESPKRWAKLQPLIAQSKGQPSVAPASDKRPEWQPEPVEDDFADETSVEALL